MPDARFITFARRKPRQLELQLQRTIWEYLQYNGVFCWITYQPLLKPGQFKMYHKSSTGVADILGIYQDRFLAIEVKEKYRTPTPAQEEFMRKVREGGGIAFVARSIEDVQKGLNIITLIKRKEE